VSRTGFRAATLAPAIFGLSACATPRLHTEQELSTAALRCNLSPGDLVQEHDLKKVLIVFRVAPTPSQRACVHQWARKRHLHLAIIDQIDWKEQ
jgi:hypothetical protein